MAPKINELGVVVRGGSPRPMGDPRYFGGDIPFMKIADVTRSNGMTVYDSETKVTAEGALRSRRLSAGSLILTNSATVCVPVFLGVDACIHDGFVAFEGLDFVNQKFLYYFFKYIRPYVLNENKQGVTQVNLNTGIVGDMSLLLPPANEQRRIVAKIEELFSELDKGVESLTTAREQLKVYRQAVLKHAFEGKLTADWRARNPEKLETLIELLFRIPERPDRGGNQEEHLDYSNQEFPNLPIGWHYIPFESITTSIRNGISQKPNENGTLKIFRISAVRPLVFDLTDFRQIDDRPEYDGFKLRRNDLVFTRYNGSRSYVGVAALYKGDESHVYPDKLIRCKVNSSLVDAAYIEKAVNSGVSRSFIESRIRTTAGQAGISGGDLKTMPVVICPLEEQIEINRILEFQLSLVTKLEADVDESLSNLNSLRQAILKKAFSGQLVPQDPNDEPASDLLERIRAGKQQTAAPKKSKTKKETAA